MSVLRGLSIIDPPFLVGLGLVTAAVFVASWFRWRRRWVRWGVRASGLVLAIMMAAAAVNARFGYLPTAAALLGHGVVDQVPMSRLRQLESAASARHAGRLRLAVSHDPVPAPARPKQGVVVAFTIPPTRSHFHARTAEVYLPPAYFESPRPRLPVIELLHGTPGSPIDWTRGGMADVTADTFASHHRGFAPVLVMPDVNGSWLADTECVNGRQGRVQTYLTADVRNAMISRFHTRRDAGGWAIAGLSEGGYCALQIGLRHPNLYSAIGDFSGEAEPSSSGGLHDLFAGTPAQMRRQAAQYDPINLLQTWRGTTRPYIWFDDGSSDPTTPVMTELNLLARARGFRTRFEVQPGAIHSFISWHDAFANALPSLAHLTEAPI